MQVETYQREVIESTSLDLSEIFEGWEQRVQLTRELDLSGQEKYISALEKAKEIPFERNRDGFIF